MNNMGSHLTKITLTITMLLVSLVSNAQVEMADDFRGEGKIYVVIAIILIIMLGFFVLLFKLDKKSKRLEKELEER